MSRVILDTHDVPTDVPDGPTQFTYVTDGIDSAVRQAKAVADSALRRA